MSGTNFSENEREEEAYSATEPQGGTAAQQQRLGNGVSCVRCRVRRSDARQTDTAIEYAITDEFLTALQLCWNYRAMTQR